MLTIYKYKINICDFHVSQPLFYCQHNTFGIHDKYFKSKHFLFANSYILQIIIEIVKVVEVINFFRII